MVGLRTLKGYLLEEAPAWLLRTSGYRLLTEADDTARPPWKVLEKRKHGLVVRGRGAWHQADALGEFPYVPPFSLPIRLFAEAKFTSPPVGLSVVRNGHGVVHDLNGPPPDACLCVSWNPLPAQSSSRGGTSHTPHRVN